MLITQSFMILRQRTKERLHELIQADKTDTSEFIEVNLRLILLNQMLNFIIKSNSWADVRTKEIFLHWLKTNYDIELVAQRHRMPAQTVEQVVKQADRIIVRKIEGPLQLIASNKLFEATMCFYQNIHKVDRKKKRSSAKKEG